MILSLQEYLDNHFQPGQLIAGIYGSKNNQPDWEGIALSHYRPISINVDIKKNYDNYDIKSYAYLTPTYIKLIKSNKKSMNFIQKLKEATLKEPEKSFRKCGITGSDGELTSDGKDVFLQWLFDQNKETFNKEVVQPILKAEEDKE